MTIVNMENIESPLPYGLYQALGRERQEFMDNPAAPCPIQPCTVTYDELNDWIPIGEDRRTPHPVQNSEVLDLARARGIEDPWVQNTLSSRELTPDGSEAENFWISYITPGNLFILYMFRASGYYGSQIAQVLYEKQHPIDTLNHIYVMDVVNENTTYLIEHQFYPENGGRLPSIDEPHIFEYGTAEYEALLGTRTGAVVAYLVLGAFSRGTRRIARVVIGNPRGECLILRFDIENVNSGSSSSDRSGSAGSKHRRTDDGEEYQQSPKRRKSLETAPESYDGPARRTRQATNRRSPGGTDEKPPPYSPF